MRLSFKNSEVVGILSRSVSESAPVVLTPKQRITLAIKAIEDGIMSAETALTCDVQRFSHGYLIYHNIPIRHN